MSPSNETEIKVHCTILVFDHENFLVTSTKIMDKRSVQNDYFADSSSVSLTNPFDNLFIHSNGLPIHLKVLLICSAILFIRLNRLQICSNNVFIRLNGLHIPSKSVREMVSQTV